MVITTALEGGVGAGSEEGGEGDAGGGSGGGLGSSFGGGGVGGEDLDFGDEEKKVMTILVVEMLW
jgi:hypothetical protein